MNAKQRLSLVALLALAGALVLGLAPPALADISATCSTGTSPFPDVLDSNIFCTNITRLVQLGITSGYSDGTFRGNNNVTRYEMAAFIDRVTQVNTDDSAAVFAVFNLINDSAASEGDVIKAYSTNGEGVEGYSTGGAVADTGVYGQSNGTGSTDAGTRGYANGDGPGLYGQGVGAAATSYGVRGVSSSTHGVYGESNAGSSAFYGGWFTGQKGVYGNAEYMSGDGTYGYCTAGTSCWGARGSSADGYGVQGNTSRSDQMYGLHTSDKVYAGAGYNSVIGFSLLAQVGGGLALEPGDAVIVSGMSQPFEPASAPLLQVGRASAATAGNVIGVVETAIQIELVDKSTPVYEETVVPDPEGEEDDVQWLLAGETVEKVAVQHAVEGVAAPGEFVVIRVQGLVRVKVDAGTGPIEAGAPLVAGNDGYSIGLAGALAAGVDPNALVIGQAMEPQLAGKGLIWVLVNPR